MNNRIVKICFKEDRIWATMTDGTIHSVPLEVFPPLFFASPLQRESYRLLGDNTSIRWDDIDEDIHISSFYENEKVNYDNEVNHLLTQFPCLDLKNFAEYLGMHWTRLARYKFGVWTPNAETLKRIKEGIRTIGKEMSIAV